MVAVLCILLAVKAVLTMCQTHKPRVAARVATLRRGPYIAGYASVPVLALLLSSSALASLRCETLALDQSSSSSYRFVTSAEDREGSAALRRPPSLPRCPVHC